MMHHRIIGNQGEDKVVAYLIKDGYTILARNYQKFYGEIDIIAHKKSLVIFVEVKVRRTDTHHPLGNSEIITRSKQKKIIMVAKEFLARLSWHEVTGRFDVAIIEGTDANQLTYIPNAFGEQTY